MNMLKCLTMVAGLLTMLASSGSAFAIMITGTINGVQTEFYQEDIWQVISDVTPDTKAEKKLLSRSDKKFIKQIGMLQKGITKLQERAEIRELNKKQANRLLKREDRLVQLLDSRDLLNRLLLAGLVDHNDFVPNDQTDGGITDYPSQQPSNEASVPEPSTLILLALGLLFIGVAQGKRTYRSQS
jgi:hypothetical protein